MSYIVRLEMRSHFIACSLLSSIPLSLRFRAYACRFRMEILYVIKFVRHCLSEGDAIIQKISLEGNEPGSSASNVDRTYNQLELIKLFLGLFCWYAGML